MEYTGRDLDIAANGDAWLAVQTPAGDEGLVKTASLQIKPNGDVWDIHGNPVMGVNGQIKIPPAESVEIGSDGTISYIPLGEGGLGRQILTQLKLVKPTDMSPENFEKGLDGFMRSKSGTEPDPLAKVQSGYLEASNVNTVQELVQMISLQRKFELQVKMMETSQKHDQKSDQLLSLR
jgi:flagellar basal-body rod protein FlgF